MTNYITVKFIFRHKHLRTSKYFYHISRYYCCEQYLLFAILTKRCKGCRQVFCIRFFLQKKDNLAKKNAGQCFSNESEATCKNSADLEEKKETPKMSLNIRLYQALHYYYCVVINFVLYVNFCHITGLILENLY